MLLLIILFICPFLFLSNKTFHHRIMSPTEGEGDILFLVRILLASALALASALT